MDAADIVRQAIHLLARVVHFKKDDVFRFIDKCWPFLQNSKRPVFSAAQIQRRQRQQVDHFPEYVTNFQDSDVTKQQVIKDSLFDLVRRQAAADVATGNHIAPRIQYPTVLAVKVRQLGQRQAINRESPVVILIVIPDIVIISAGRQDGFGFAKCDHASAPWREGFNLAAGHGPEFFIITLFLCHAAFPKYQPDGRSYS
ncbi:hypothetical protein BY08_20195 [Escherichia coli O103:H2 str. 2011C-3750]|nr:hypothetical protein BY08_20195 [Escherichia coli O103:H2 str. 2011C-3750]KDM87066.1 hypothetical protein DC22_11180 [Escherichia coli]